VRSETRAFVDGTVSFTQPGALQTRSSEQRVSMVQFRVPPEKSRRVPLTASRTSPRAPVGSNWVAVLVLIWMTAPFGVPSLVSPWTLISPRAEKLVHSLQSGSASHASEQLASAGLVKSTAPLPSRSQLDALAVGALLTTVPGPNLVGITQREPVSLP